MNYTFHDEYIAELRGSYSTHMIHEWCESVYELFRHSYLSNCYADPSIETAECYVRLLPEHELIGIGI